MRWRCPVASVVGAPNWYWLTVGQGLLSLQQVRVEGGCCYFFCSFTLFHFPLSSLSLSFISSTISSVSFLPFSGRWHKMTHKEWRVVKLPQHNQSVKFLMEKLRKLSKNYHHLLLGPVVQSVVSLTSSLRVISLTVLADSIYNILIFFAGKMWVVFALQKLHTFFQQKISAYLRITRCKF